MTNVKMLEMVDSEALISDYLVKYLNKACYFLQGGQSDMLYFCSVNSRIRFL